MPQSLSAVYVHVVFSTKDRKRYLPDIKLRTSLHAYIGSVCKRLHCSPVRVGGVEYHVHILINLARNTTLGSLIKETKRLSNIWLKDQSNDLHDFKWQRGYSCFSVSQSNLDAVVE